MKCYECAYLKAYDATYEEPGECWCGLDMEEFFDDGLNCEEFESEEALREYWAERRY